MVFTEAEHERMKKMYLNKTLVLYVQDEKYDLIKVSEHFIVAILNNHGIVTILAKNHDERLYKKINGHRALLRKGIGKIPMTDPKMGYRLFTYKIFDRHNNLVIDSAEQSLSNQDFL